MHAIEQALLWLDAGTARFWTVAWCSFGFTALLAVVPSRRDRPVRWLSHVVFALGVFLTMAAFRWPSWYFPTDLNPDEAQHVASAVTLDAYPVYWRYVDGSTHGPWCEYMLLIPHWLGAPIDYFSARVVSAFLEAAAVLAVWGTLRGFATERIARLAALPALAFWSFVSWEDYVHYSTELPGIFFLAVAGWLTAVVVRAPEPGRRHLWVAGLAGCCLGNVPFAKLQSVPQALAMVLITVVLWLVGKPGVPLRRRLSLVAAYVLGGLLPALVLSVFLTGYGLWGEFYVSAIKSAVAYIGVDNHRLIEMPILFFHFAYTEPAFVWFFGGCLAFTLVYVRARTPQSSLRAGLVVSWILLGVAYFCVLRPGREVAHYLQLLVIPATILAGFALAAAASESGTERPSFWRAIAPAAVFILLTLVPQVYHRSVTFQRFVGFVREYRQQPLREPAQFIRAHSTPGETMAMWGWDCHLLVETGLPHGTREPQSAYQLVHWPLREYYLKRYLADLQARKPAWFVDVVGAGAFVFEDRATMGHENFPGLAEFIDDRYQAVAEFKNLRVYRLKESPLAP